MLRALTFAVRAAGLTCSLLTSSIMIGTLVYGIYKSVQPRKQ